MADAEMLKVEILANQGGGIDASSGGGGSVSGSVSGGVGSNGGGSATASPAGRARNDSNASSIQSAERESCAPGIYQLIASTSSS